MPVLAWPMMSCPESATGRVIAWIGNGVVMPWPARADTMSGWIGKSAKVCSTAVACLVASMAASSGMASAVAGSAGIVWLSVMGTL